MKETADRAILPAHGFALEVIRTAEHGLVLCLRATRSWVTCPDCGRGTNRCHGYYTRTLRDLPWHGIPVEWRVRTRRFRCVNPACRRRIFVERLPGVKAHARRTERLGEALTAIALALGGEAGARVAGQIGIRTSPDTLLRVIRSVGETLIATPRVLGVDDWAIRKRKIYGTLLYDLENHRPVDLLPERSSDTLRDWLEKHPGVEMISRDRSGAYAEGATLGAPRAIQIADRWHLIKNLGDAVERACSRCLKQPQKAKTVELKDVPDTPVESPRQEAERLHRRARRKERFDKVWELHKKGASQVEICRQTGLSHKTVRKYLRTNGVFPEIQPRAPRPGVLDPYKPYLLKRWQEGCHNATRLLEEIRSQGYPGRLTIVKSWLHRLRVHGPPPPRPKTPREVAFLLMRNPVNLSDSDKDDLEELLKSSETLWYTHKLVQAFLAMLRQRKGKELEHWLQLAEHSPIPELHAFTAGIRNDFDAVQAGLTLPWSQGPVEGCIHKLKLIKRQGYGRASLAHLRARLLAGA